MTKITDQEISRIAKLSMLDIPEAEYARLKQDMEGIIEMVDKLGELEIDPQFDRYTAKARITCSVQMRCAPPWRASCCWKTRRLRNRAVSSSPKSSNKEFAMELYEYTAHELAAMLREKRVSAKEITESVFQRIRAVESMVDAYISLSEESALRQAAAVDEKLAAGKRFRRWLVSLSL